VDIAFRPKSNLLQKEHLESEEHICLLKTRCENEGCFARRTYDEGMILRSSTSHLLRETQPDVLGMKFAVGNNPLYYVLPQRIQRSLLKA
jgi:hypothetical protein